VQGERGAAGVDALLAQRAAEPAHDLRQFGVGGQGQHLVALVALEGVARGGLDVAREAVHAVGADAAVAQADLDQPVEHAVDRDPVGFLAGGGGVGRGDFVVRERLGGVLEQLEHGLGGARDAQSAVAQLAFAVEGCVGHSGLRLRGRCLHASRHCVASRAVVGAPRRIARLPCQIIRANRTDHGRHDTTAWIRDATATH